MNWHAISSFVWGFALMPALLMSFAAFVYIGMTFDLDRALSGAGMASAFGILVLTVAIGLIFSR